MPVHQSAVHHFSHLVDFVFCECGMEAIRWTHRPGFPFRRVRFYNTRSYYVVLFFFFLLFFFTRNVCLLLHTNVVYFEIIFFCLSSHRYGFFVVFYTLNRSTAFGSFGSLFSNIFHSIRLGYWKYSHIIVLFFLFFSSVDTFRFCCFEFWHIFVRTNFFSSSSSFQWSFIEQM